MFLEECPGSAEIMNSTQMKPKYCCRRTCPAADSREFSGLALKGSQEELAQELERLAQTALPDDKEKILKEFAGFKKLFESHVHHEPMDWSKIQILPAEAVQAYDTLNKPSEDRVKAMLDRLVVVKLNGGLGTSMGCQGPKSIIAVRDDLTFLDLTVQQIEYLNQTYKTNVPLVLMNSFNTDEDTQKVIRKYKGFQLQIVTFNQSRYPRIARESLHPVAKHSDMSEPEAWYPPGHGDFYQSFYDSGVLHQMIAQRKEYCFISNIDNLGATVDMNILNKLMTSDGKTEFIMEVTDKTRADVKGGTLTMYEDKLCLLEIAQVPKEHVVDFQSVKTFKIFNTNNLWVKLSSIQKAVEMNTLDLEVIPNYKTLENGLDVLQLETAVGAAIKSFEGCIGINVPRSRFLPVKKTQDLLLVMSNLYALHCGSLVMSPKRMFPGTPLIKLGDNFSKVKQFLDRFQSIPDMLELDHLTVAGDVTFGPGVSLKGTVIIIANHGDRIDIPPGAVLENKIVSGNLRIMVH